MLRGIYLNLNEPGHNGCHVKDDLFKFKQKCLAPVPEIGTSTPILEPVPLILLLVAPAPLTWHWCHTFGTGAIVFLRVPPIERHIEQFKDCVFFKKTRMPEN